MQTVLRRVFGGVPEADKDRSFLGSFWNAMKILWRSGQHRPQHSQPLIIKEVPRDFLWLGMALLMLDFAWGCLLWPDWELRDQASCWWDCSGLAGAPFWRIIFLGGESLWVQAVTRESLRQERARQQGHNSRINRLPGNAILSQAKASNLKQSPAQAKPGPGQKNLTIF